MENFLGSIRECLSSMAQEVPGNRAGVQPECQDFRSLQGPLGQVSCGLLEEYKFVFLRGTKTLFCFEFGQGCCKKSCCQGTDGNFFSSITVPWGSIYSRNSLGRIFFFRTAGPVGLRIRQAKAGWICKGQTQMDLNTMAKRVSLHYRIHFTTGHQQARSPLSCPAKVSSSLDLRTQLQEHWCPQVLKLRAGPGDLCQCEALSDPIGDTGKSWETQVVGTVIASSRWRRCAAIRHAQRTASFFYSMVY